MRLIDADKLHIPPEDIGSRMAVAYAPTVYDVDKVMNELAELAECSSECASTFYEGLGCSACIWADVIKIVKRGGIDGTE